MNISVLIISFKSSHLLEKIISFIPANYEVLVIENSLNQKVKKLEKLFANTRVIIPTNNLGYSKATNLGLSETKNDLVWLMTPDINFSRDTIISFEKLLKNFKDFALIAPTYIDNKMYKNYHILNNSVKDALNIENYSLSEVDDIDWCLCLINKKKFSENKILDENYFLYFETMDFAIQIRKKKEKIYVVNNLKFSHRGTSSSSVEYKKEISINRNWHFCWSKFYYFKKNFSYLYALRKIMPNLLRSIKNIIIGKILNKNEILELSKAEFLGSINSIFLKKSSYRPKIKLD